MSQCHISWDSYKKNISNGFSHLQQREEFVDMTLAAEGHFVKVHRNLIALASPYLKDMLQSAPCPHPVVFLNNVSHDVLGYILEYVYTGEVEVPMDLIIAFIDTAKALHLKGLDSVTAPTVPRGERTQRKMNKMCVNAKDTEIYPKIHIEKDLLKISEPFQGKETQICNNNENVTTNMNLTFIYDTEEIPIKIGDIDVNMDNSRIDNCLEANNPSQSMMETQTCIRNEQVENSETTETMIDDNTIREEPIGDILRKENNPENNQLQLDTNMEQLQGLYYNKPLLDLINAPIIDTESCNLTTINTHHNVINSCDLNLPSQSYNFTIRNATDENTIPRIDIISAAMGEVFSGPTLEVDHGRDNLNDINLPVHTEVDNGLEDNSNNESVHKPEIETIYIEGPITPSSTIKVPGLSSGQGVNSETMIPSCAPNIRAMDLSGTSPLYSLSSKGSIQLIFNRYIYNCHHSSKQYRKRRWRCIDYRREKCKAVIDTEADIIVKRKLRHTHPFHENKILKKGRNNMIFTTISEVKEAEKSCKDDL